MRSTRQTRRLGIGLAAVVALALGGGIIATGRVGLELAFVTRTPLVTATTPPPGTPTQPPTAVEVATQPAKTDAPTPIATSTLSPTPAPTLTLTLGPTDFPKVDASRLGGGSGVLAFVSEREGNPEIYTMALDGSRLERLTYSDADDLSPRFSPDGAQIAFRANRDAIRPALYLMNADGSRQRALVSDGRFNEFPAWWPDGSRLLFDSDALGPFQIFSFELASGIVTPLLPETPTADDAVAAVSPDGARIAFQSRRGGDAYQIYTVGSGGADLVRLTFTSARNDHPAWSPDGRTLAFVSERSGRRELFLMNADGTDQRALVVDQGDIRLPRFSPDGRWIVFSSNRDGDFDLYLVSVDGKEFRRLTDHPADDYSPDWQP